MMTPAPFYLVWPEKVDKLRYPWPYQLISIELQPVSSYYDAAAPKQQTEAINKGFQLFSTYCIRCHSINLIGGNVGPELNIPKNVTEYFMASELPGFIRNAPSYQAGTKMPVFEDVINEQQAQQIIQYLQQKKSEKIQ